MNGGLNDNESFAGPGNDFVIAGAGADAVFGDGGDDWIQGGLGQDLLQGDHGAPFFDDPAETAPGNDIFVGQAGENDYDAEGGDDIMSQNAAIDRNAGAGGFDWAIHQYDTVGADDDMKINQQLAGLAAPGGRQPRPLAGDRGRLGLEVQRRHPRRRHGAASSAGFGFTGCDALDPAGVARINGLDKLVTTFPSPLQPTCSTSRPSGPARWRVTAERLHRGRGTSGPRATSCSVVAAATSSRVAETTTSSTVTTRSSVRDHRPDDPADPATEIGRTDLMEHTGHVRELRCRHRWDDAPAGSVLRPRRPGQPGRGARHRHPVQPRRRRTLRRRRRPAPSADGTVHLLRRRSTATRRRTRSRRTHTRSRPTRTAASR